MLPNKVTIKEVAEKLNISMMTVSRALNNKPNVDKRTREIVVKTARKMGYIQNHIAKSLVQKKTNTIGIVVPEITHSFFPDAIRGIEEVLYKNGYQIIFTHSNENAEREIRALETLASKRVDGILISMAQTVTEYSFYKQIMKMKLPLVFFDRCVFDIGASCVGIDDKESARTLTRYLIEKGYRRIAHLAGSLSVSIGRDRLSGYKAALKQAGLKINNKWILKAGFHEYGGYKAMKELLALAADKLPEAVVCVNDPAAFGAIKAIKEKKLKVPDDIAVVGFSDDIRSELITPALTTIHQPAYEVGKMAAKKLLAHIENKNEKVESIFLDTNLIVRNSTK